MGQQKRMFNLNRGLIAANQDGQEIIIRTKILKDSLQFSFAGDTVTARIEKKECLAEFERVKDNMFEKRSFEGMKHALRHLLKNKSLKFDAGILSVGEYTFSFVVVQNGFLAHYEIMPDNIVSFGVIHQDDAIMLAKQQGEWNVKKQEQEIIAHCKDYYDALDKIIKEIEQIFANTVKDLSEKRQLH
jgi:hypothetical protein